MRRHAISRLMSQCDATHVTALSIRWQRELSNTSAHWSHAASHQSLPSKNPLLLTGIMSSFGVVFFFTLCGAFFTLWITMWRQIEQYTLKRNALMESLHICHIDELWLWECDSKLQCYFPPSICNNRHSDHTKPGRANWLPTTKASKTPELQQM